MLAGDGVPLHPWSNTLVCPRVMKVTVIPDHGHFDAGENTERKTYPHGNGAWITLPELEGDDFYAAVTKKGVLQTSTIWCREG